MIDVNCDRPLGVSSPVSSSFFLTGLPLCGYFNILDYSAFYTIIEVVALVWSTQNQCRIRLMRIPEAEFPKGYPSYLNPAISPTAKSYCDRRTRLAFLKVL